MYSKLIILRAICSKSRILPLKPIPPFRLYCQKAVSLSRNSQFIFGKYIPQIRPYSSVSLSRSEIEERVLNVLKNSDKINASNLGLDTAFSQLGLDSLDVVEVMVNLEEEFHLQIPDSVADKIEKPSEVVEYIYDFLHPHKKAASEPPMGEDAPN